MDRRIWSLTTFVSHQGAGDQAGIQLDDGGLVQPACLRAYAGLIEAVLDWPVVEAALRDLDPYRLTPIPDAVALAPLRFPPKLICSGANYRDHVREMGTSEVPAGMEPFFLLLPPTTTLAAVDDTICVPADHAAQIDWEAELAIVIGRGGSDIAVDDALRHVAGYACFNDITARGYHRRQVSLGPPLMFDWLGAKGRDGFCPMGPITPWWRAPASDAMNIRCIVNGEVRQRGHTSDMIFGVAELVAAASRTFTLEAGDVIASGTPAGIGMVSGEFLHPGDEVAVEIDGLAKLRNTIAALPSGVRHRSADGPLRTTLSAKQ